jgi:glycosyltransferase involved in cell wall biosynthesis
LNHPISRRRILIVAYFYPPMNIIGARRPYALAKWLRRRGHDVTVLTSLHTGRDGGGDPTNAATRARDLLATRLNWRPSNLEVATGQRAGDWETGPGVWGSIFVPDVQLISWAPFAIGVALRLQRRAPFDAVITTSPVESAHGVGLALRRRGVPWIVDLRDGWGFESPRGSFPLRLQRRLDLRLERTVLSNADAVVTISGPITADIQARHGVDATTITNGYDPDDLAAARAPSDALDPAKISFVHTGALSWVPGKTLEPVLTALQRLAVEDPALPDRVELVLAGAQTESERALYARPDFSRFIRQLGFLPREQALGLQQQADVLVLVTSGLRASEATGKLYEYLGARRPILALATGTAAGEIVAGAGAGRSIPVRDPDAAERAIRELLAGPLPAISASAAEPYAYPALAARYEQVVERAIADAAARAGARGRP